MFRLVKTCLNKGLNTLFRLRLGKFQTHNGVTIPMFYLTSKHLTSRDKKLTGAVILSIILSLILTLLFLKFYVFEADIQLIYLDTTDDILQINGQYRSHYDEEWDGNKVSLAGWKYFKTFADSGLKIEASSSAASFNPGVEKLNDGYWIALPPKPYGENEGDNDQQKLFIRNRIQANNKIRLHHFQFFLSHEVRLAIRFYARGFSRIYMTFESSWSTETESIAIYPENNDSQSQQNGFCTLIIEPPFGGHVKTIDIAAIAYNQKSFVAIDKIVMAVGNDKRSLHMLYTLLSQGWCSKSIKLQEV